MGQMVINAMAAGVVLCLIMLAYELINGYRLGQKDE